MQKSATALTGRNGQALIEDYKKRLHEDMNNQC